MHKYVIKHGVNMSSNMVETCFQKRLKLVSEHIVRAGESRGTWEPGSQKILRSNNKFLLWIPPICRKNVKHLRRPKLRKKIIISHKKLSSCDRKNTVGTQKMNAYCKRRKKSSYWSYILFHRKEYQLCLAGKIFLVKNFFPNCFVDISIAVHPSSTGIDKMCITNALYRDRDW